MSNYVVTIVSRDQPDHYPYVVGPFDSVDEADAWLARFVQVSPINGVEARVRPVWNVNNVSVERAADSLT